MFSIPNHQRTDFLCENSSGIASKGDVICHFLSPALLTLESVQDPC